MDSDTNTQPINPSAPKPLTTKRVLLTSLIVDACDVVINTVVALFTGSIVMLVNALQDLAGLCSVGLLLVGLKRADKRPSRRNPFGYGKEMYYWSTLAAFTVVAMLAALAFYFGYKEFSDPTSIKHIALAYVMLTIAIIANSYSFMASSRKLLEGHDFKDLFKVFMTSPHIAPKTTVVLDAMGTLVGVAGLFALILQGATGNNAFDGLGAMFMGLVLAVFAVLLLISVRSLVTSQSATPEMERRIRDAVREVTEVRHVVGMRTMMLGSDKLLVNIDVHLRDGLTTDQVEAVVEKIKEAAEQTGDDFSVHVEPDPEHHVVHHV